MKTIVIAGLCAIGLIALSQQQASAWKNSRFGIGLNWSAQSGGNNFGWGLWHNGQVPGPEAFGAAPHGDGHDATPYYGSNSVPQGYAPQHAYYPSTPTPSYAGQYASRYQFANYPRPIYYSPAPSYYYYGQ